MNAKRCTRCGELFDDESLERCPHDGASLRSAADPLLGRVIAGRYELVARVGEGGMGTVYRARQASVHRDVAVKILRPEIAMDPAVRARFAREARSASRVASVRVSTIFDFGETEDGLLFLAMELLQGETLAQRLAREGALPVTEAVRIAMEIARALEVAHEAGVVHRDLKPENVFLETRDRLVKVLDFGIAKMMVGEDDVPSGRAITAAGTIIGTPLYMSPEAAARRGRVGAAADLYTLGIILFEMLVGRPPFDEAEPVLLLGMHLRVPAPALREARSDLELPPALEVLVAQLLAKRAEDRPPNARDVAERLQALPATSSPAPDPEPQPARTTQPSVTPLTASSQSVASPGRARWLVPVVAALVLAGTIAAVLPFWTRPREPPSRPVARNPPTPVLAPTEDDDPLASAHAQSARGALREALASYRTAYERDRSVRDDPRTKSDLVRMTVSSDPLVRTEARGALDTWYGTELASMLDQLLRVGHWHEAEAISAEEREQLQELRAELRGERSAVGRRRRPQKALVRAPASGRRRLPVD